uniref:OBP28 n=1 Tax=Episyrphus balteatus TaxID=286459 RepID=A0A6H0D4D9_EPIBA|nr:OBP28 [Episyrphus balteatus]
MKYLIFISFVIALFDAAKAASTEQSTKYIAECRAEFKITDDVKHYNLTTGAIPEADATEDMKCYLNCFMEKLGVLKDGKIQEDAQEFKNYVGEEHAKEEIESCRGETGSSKCETAFKLHQCFLKHLDYLVLQVFSLSE